MRTLLAIMLLAAAVLPTWSHAQELFYIRDRTPQVIHAIWKHLPRHTRYWAYGDAQCYVR